MAVVIYIIIGVVLGYFISGFLSKGKTNELHNNTNIELEKKTKECELLVLKNKDSEVELEKVRTDMKQIRSSRDKQEDKLEELEDNLDDLKKKYNLLLEENEAKTNKLSEYAELYELRKKEIVELNNRLRNE